MSRTIAESVGIGTAHGKVILMGEHAVVYGEPAIALPFYSLSVRVAITAASQEDVLDCQYYRGPLRAVPDTLEGLKRMIEAVHQPKTTGSFLSIVISSIIPPGYGLGSSAAVAAALIRALYAFYRRPLTQQDLLAFVNIAETHAHGNPSGVDSWTTISPGPLWFVRGRHPLNIPLSRPVRIVVAASNIPGHTLDAIHHVREKLPFFDKKNTPIIRLGKLSQQAMPALGSGDYIQLGRLMTQAHRELDCLGVSTRHLNHLVTRAMKAGALGAKLTGSGGGGSMLALTADKEEQKRVKAALTQAGAARVWTVTIGAS